MATKPVFAALGDERFVSLTTFRRSGDPVSTAVWIGREGDALVVTTPEASGKIKRIRNNARVELRPCNRFGTVKDGVESIAGVAEMVHDAGNVERLTKIIREKYGLEYRIVMGVERLVKRGDSERIILRITAV